MRFRAGPTSDRAQIRLPYRANEFADPSACIRLAPPCNDTQELAPKSALQMVGPLQGWKTRKRFAPLRLREVRKFPRICNGCKRYQKMHPKRRQYFHPVTNWNSTGSPTRQQQLRTQRRGPTKILMFSSRGCARKGPILILKEF